MTTPDAAKKPMPEPWMTRRCDECDNTCYNVLNGCDLPAPVEMSEHTPCDAAERAAKRIYWQDEPEENVADNRLEPLTMSDVEQIIREEYAEHEQARRELAEALSILLVQIYNLIDGTDHYKDLSLKKARTVLTKWGRP